MIITAGAQLGPYKVISPLRSGGMGEVWRARDTRLDREVAIKVLPAVFAKDAELMLVIANLAGIQVWSSNH